MKQRYILPALLLLCAACQQEEWAQPEADSPDAIRFAAPAITVEKVTRSTFHDAFPTNGTFGVLGYCVPYQRGSDTQKDWASGSSPWDNKNSNAFPDVFYKQAVTYDGSACSYNTEDGGLRNGTTRRTIRRRSPQTTTGTPSSPITRWTILWWKVLSTPPHGVCRS